MAELESDRPLDLLFRLSGNFDVDFVQGTAL